MFEEAKSCVSYAFLNYNLLKVGGILKDYYNYQLKLIEEENTKHI
jgi:hypothetical protein